MATSTLHVVLFFVLIFTLVEAHTAVAEVVVSHNCEALRIEVDKLTSKIQSLELIIDKKNQELKSKDETIAQKEKTIADKEKSSCIPSLQSEVAKLQSYEKSHWKGYGKPAFESFLQKVLEVMAVAGKWAEPYVKTMKTSYAGYHWKQLGKSAFVSFLHKVLEVMAVAGKWAEPYVKTMKTSYAGYHWKQLGKSAFVSFLHKVLEKKAQAEKWAKPHVATIKTKWIPAAMEKSMLVINKAEPHLQSLAKMMKYVYIQFTDILTQQLVRVTRKINAFLQA